MNIKLLILSLTLSLIFVALSIAGVIFASKSKIWDGACKISKCNEDTKAASKASFFVGSYAALLSCEEACAHYKVKVA